MNDSDHSFARVMAGRVGVVTVAPDGTISDGVAEELTVLSGAFNPLHQGHEGMLTAAMGITGNAGVFELSIMNVEKPELPEAEVRERISQFAGRYTALISRAPTFLEKSRIMPGASFVIGYDTAVRLFDDSYYPAYQREADPENTGSATLAAMSEIRRNGCEFIVAGRVTDHGFKTVRDLGIPDGYRPMLRGISVEVFRQDISSTQIRRSLGTN
jgi:phosphopantetheine adenylyltransferase|tara:strand:+ start:1141 stop:1782 length:642 start_codon:yes stop_codon:yes gene_type:complete